MRYLTALILFVAASTAVGADEFPADPRATAISIRSDANAKVFQVRADPPHRPGVSVSTGTGFLVGGRYIVTCRHIGARHSVELADTGIVASRVFVTSAMDGPAVYRLDGDTKYKSLSVAERAPEVGEFVVSLGVPDNSSMVEARWGHVTSVGRFRLAGSVPVTSVSVPSRPGFSGGPLLNQRGEVVGITLTTGLTDSQYATWESVVEAMRAVNGQAVQRPLKPHQLVMFSMAGCGPCEAYKREIAAISADVRVVDIHSDAPADRELIAEFRRRTGRGIDATPTFWVAGTDRHQTAGYEPGLLRRIIGWAASIIEAIGRGIFGDPAPQPAPRQPLRPEPDDIAMSDGPPIPEPPSEDAAPVPSGEPVAEQIDPEDVEVIVLVARTAAADKAGPLAGIGISVIRPLIQRRINDALEGRAGVTLVDERTRPETYSAIVQATGIVPDPAALIVLVQKQPLGLKGLIAGKIERAARDFADKLGGPVQVELIFERGHSADYQAALAALATPSTSTFSRPSETADGESAPQRDESLKSALIDAVKAAAIGAVNDRLKSLPAPEISVPQPENNKGLLYTLIGLAGAHLTGWAVERGWKGRLAARAAKIALSQVAAKGREAT